MPPTRLFGLDLLRAIAVLSVVYGHGYPLVNGLIDARSYAVLALDGVTIFFVLSGFLIGRVMCQELLLGAPFRPRLLLHFWKRRWLRTLPAYAVVLLLLLGIQVLQGRPLPAEWLRYFVFAQNLAWPHPDFFQEAWSLAVEEWFYLVFPIVLLLATRWTGARSALLFHGLVAFVVLATVWRMRAFDASGVTTIAGWAENIAKVVIYRFDALAMGLACAWLSLYRQAAWLRFRRAGLVCGTLTLFATHAYALATQAPWFFGQLYLSLTALATCLFLPCLTAMQPPRSRLLEKAITGVSLISYSMYLVHHSLVRDAVLHAFMERLALNGSGTAWTPALVSYMLYWALTLLAALLLWRQVERPFMRLRDRTGPA